MAKKGKTQASSEASPKKSRRKIARTGRKRSTSRSKHTVLPESGSYLRKSHMAVRSHLAAAQSLSQFLEGVSDLTIAQKRTLVEQALVLIEDNYVHLPLKAAMHAVEPVQRLKLLEHRLEKFDEDYLFHREMTEIFSSLRDLHTNYLLPAPFNSMRAFLPFAIERYFEQGKARYLAAHLVSGFSHPTFKQGVEILKWSGVPVDRAIEIVANQNAGSNLAARRARGIERMTFRPFIVSLPPDEEWVEVEYRTESQAIETERFEWLVIPQIADGSFEPSRSDARVLGIDLEMQQIQTLKRQLIAPQVIREEKQADARRAAASRSATQSPQKRQAAAGSLKSDLPGVLTASVVDTPSGQFGYIRLRTFAVSPDDLVPEFIRLLNQLPLSGVIIDVRGNGGGIIHSGERLLQLLTPNTIQPEPTQFINTPLNLEICRRHGFLDEWVESLERAVETGATFSQGFPITPADECNDIGQVYTGPSVLITDARCYSTTDIFAAGFQDHQIGLILGVDDNTGAGGANVWTHDLLHRFFPSSAKGSPYRRLPRDAGMRVSIRRTLRVGANAGMPVEDIGVVPDEIHEMTRDDLLGGNADLINHAAALLKEQNRHTLVIISATRSDENAEVIVETEGVSRLDFYLDGRPGFSEDVDDGETTFDLEGAAGAGAILIKGYFRNKLVASSEWTE